MSNKNVIYFGVLAYGNTSEKYKSSNIGDYVQSLAALNVYRKFINKNEGIDMGMEDFLHFVIHNSFRDYKFVFLNRDIMSSTPPLSEVTLSKEVLGSEKVITIMNGWFLHPCTDEGDTYDWPPKNDFIDPIFTSFHISKPEVICSEAGLDYLKKHEPIGCRDLDTLNLLQEKGVSCYFSACLTMTMDFLQHQPAENPFHYIVDIFNFPEDKLKANDVIFHHCDPSYRVNSAAQNLNSF